MKKYFKSIIAFTAICVLALSCQEDIDTGYSFDTYHFSGLDAQGGTWKTILIGDVNQYDVKLPDETNSAAYLKELSDLKTASAKPSTEQLNAIKYWGNNGLIRWNEIARDLVSKYNLPPAPNPGWQLWSSKCSFTFHLSLFPVFASAICLQNVGIFDCSPV